MFDFLENSPKMSKSTKLCPLVGSGILYIGSRESFKGDHPKDHSLFGLGLFWVSFATVSGGAVDPNYTSQT